MLCKPIVILLLAGHSLGTAANQPQGPSVAAEAACTSPVHRAFDFWLGSWRVYAATGELAGHNQITTDEDGCVLVERWRGAQGGTGQSLNFYDPVARVWRQVWASPGVVIDIAGNLEQGSMVLTGAISYAESGQRLPFRGTWTLLPDGRVRQFFEEFRSPSADPAGASEPSDESAAEWLSWFEGFYVKHLE